MDDRTPVVDCHAHVVPEALLASLDGTSGFAASRVDGGWRLELPGGGTRLIKPGMTQASARAGYLERQGIDAQVLSPWVDVQPPPSMPAGEARSWARRLTRGLLAEAGPGDRVFASVALDDPDDAAADLAAAVTEDGAAGLILSTNPYHVRDLADPRLEPLWSALEQLGVPALLHPPADGPARSLPDAEEYGNTYCRLVDTSFAVARLLLAGVLDRHPGLRLVTVHGGGFLPYQSLRLDGGHRADGLSGHRIERESPSDYLGDLYYDTVAMSPAAIAFLTGTVGAGHVLLGTDYPFPIGDPTPVGTVTAAGLSTADEAAVLGGNVAALLGGGVHA
ncbi:MAG TPA: amidohydrolase family protein [Mycobacteriales bacterium]|nr:amidohydrolase family protein [Mycobacteriales bacterium]